MIQDVISVQGINILNFLNEWREEKLMTALQKKVRIRKAEIGDARKIAEFLRASHRRFQLVDAPVSAEQITQECLKTYIFRNSHFDINTVFLASQENELKGVMFVKRIRKEGLIPVLVVEDFYLKRIGNLLLRKAKEFLISSERSKLASISIGKAIPLYPIASRIRSKEEKSFIQFLSEQGFKITSGVCVTMEIQTGVFKVPKFFKTLAEKVSKEGIYFRRCKADDFKELLSVINNNFEDEWRQFVLDVKDHCQLNFIQLMILKDRIIGFCSYGARSIGEPELVFGPIGVIENFRGKGRGTVLLVKSLQDAIKLAQPVKIVLSTTQDRIRFYEQAGFRVTHTYVSMKKNLLRS